MGKRYTQEQLDFLREGFKAMTVSQLTQAFNKEYGLDKSELNIHTLIGYHKLSSGKKNKPIKQTRGQPYTKEQLAYLRRLYKSKDMKTLTRAFNKKYGEKRTETAIQATIDVYKLQSKRKKGLHWSFEKKIGAERVCPNTGFIVIKIDEPSPYWSGKTRQRHKHKVVWEKEHGPLQDGCCVRFKDGDKMNCTLENLFLVSRTENMFLNHLGFNNAPDELRETIRLTAKLKAKASERNKELLD